ncbi:MAG: SusC/RagA family TonB-linked outer membrane protein [Bacteroidetes bacterium]|jgi:TonB-linked SusC/RagA family outer membrane protein|nr:SusC/RagA family TonB-linked outer membrane protein [Bacteroidota bacterium]
MGLTTLQPNLPPRMKARMFLAGFLFMLIPLASYGQHTVTGTITDIDNQPLIGVNIVEKGTTNGAVTNVNGNYTITTEPDAVLVFSYVGYLKEEIPINERTEIDLTLAPDIQGLDEVVVIGYGQVKKSDISGSVASVSMDDVEGVISRSTSEILRGRASGVLVSSTSGKPGSDPEILIRGQNSINQDTDPLIVVDGIPGVELNAINVNDIQSIEVLKDAASTAIYGSAGANGVILVTTKKGEAGKTSIHFESRAGVSYFNNFVDMMNARENYEYLKDLLKTADENTRNAILSRFSDSYDNDLETPTLGTIDTTNFVDNNWQKEVFSPAYFQDYSLSMTGGGEKSSYHTSLSFMNNEGIVKPSDYKIVRFRVNVDTRLANRITWTNNVSYYYSKQVGLNDGSTGYDGGLMSIFWYNPFLPTRDPDNPSRFFINPIQPQVDNPLAAIEGQKDQESFTNRLDGKTSLNIEIIPGLTSTTNFMVNINNGYSRSYLSKLHTYNGRQQGGSANFGGGLNVDLRFEQLLNYQNTIGRNYFNLMGGFINFNNNNNSWNGNSGGYPGDNVHYVQTGTNNNSASNDLGQSRKLSFIGRLQYSFDDTYVLQGNVRYDGSSKFGPQTRWGLFPSGSAAWKMENMDFIQLNFPWISQLKPRISYGVSGNDRIDNYRYLDTYGAGGPGSGTFYNDQDLNTAMLLDNDIYPGAGPLFRFNPGLGWEETKETNAGIDLGFFEGRISFTAEYYRRKSDKLLYDMPLPRSTGFNESLVNIASVLNSGVDFSLRSHNLGNNLKWTTSITYSFNKNEVLSLVEENEIQFDGDKAVIVGYPVWGFWGYKTDGLYETQEEIDNGPTPPASVQPGDVKYQNTNTLLPEGETDDEINSDDYAYLGSGIPSSIFSMNNSFRYKGLELTIFIQGIHGKKIYNRTRAWLESMTNPFNVPVRMKDRWPYDKTSGIPRANYQDQNNGQFSDRWIEDGSYVRLKDIVLGYNLPSQWFSDINMGGVKIYLSAQNMLTFTNYSGLDPEVGDTDPGRVPQFKTIVLGLDVNL